MALSPCTRFAILGCANNTARMYDIISGEGGTRSCRLSMDAHAASAAVGIYAMICAR